MKKITDDVFYVGVNDHKIDLFEGQYKVPDGMAYNSYVILDSKIAVVDTVDKNFTHEWLDNVEEALQGRKPDYLIVQHMEPDHSANIMNFLKVYKDVCVVGNAKTFKFAEQFFGTDIKNKLVVNEYDTLSLGKHTLTFVFAPMVHWPEVMFTYDDCDKALFSADAFGKFGALDVDAEWACEARRYYFGIVGKYGAQVQQVLKKAAALNIQKILPLHGPVLTENLGYYLDLYNTWSSYEAESDGVMIFYTSVYGHTKEAVLEMQKKLIEKGCPKVGVCDLARDDMSEAVEDAFRYGKIVFATTTYNASVFPFMHTFLDELAERNFCNKTIAIIENGSWAVLAGKVIKDILAKCRNLTFLEPTVKILSSMNDENHKQIDEIVEIFTREYAALEKKTEDKVDTDALLGIGYGLYVVTSNDGKKDNGLIVNTVSQLTSAPLRVAVTINKENYSHHVIRQTGIMNVNCLSEDAPFKVFQTFGFASGRNTDKFEGKSPLRSDNGLAVLQKHVNAYMSLKVEDYVDLQTHGMFICSVTESRVLSDGKTMTYSYYQENVKPKPDKTAKGYVCKVCGYVYEGETLPDDYVCPLCKHGAADFEKID